MRNAQAYRQAQTETKQNWETHKISSLQDFENLIMEMDRAEGRPVYVLDKPLTDKKTISSADIGTVELAKLHLDTKHKAVVNGRTGNVAQVASAGYQILPHGEFFSAVYDGFVQRGCRQLQGYLIKSHNGNRARIRVIFDDSAIEEPGHGRNIRIGGEFSNSYDSAFAATGKAFFLRMSCMNQFVARNIIKEALFSRAHSAATQLALLEAVTIELEHFMGNLDAMGLTFKNYMLDAMDDEIVIQSPDQIRALMKDIFKVDTHAEGIAQIALRGAKVHPRDPRLHITTRWELVQAATYYSSHEMVTPQVQDSIFYRTEVNLLKPATIELPPVPAQ